MLRTLSFQALNLAPDAFPDLAFNHLRASKSADRRISFNQKMSIDGQ